MPQSTIEKWTFLDAVDHLADVYDVNQGDRPYRSLIRAVVGAYREVPNKNQWSYYTRRGMVTTDAYYNTGTIAYDHTGGTYERQLTLSGGTWPSWAKYGSVIISSTRYVVDAVKSSTVLTLTEQSNPGEDVTAGTSYSIFRSTYPVPSDAISFAGTLFELGTGYEVPLVPPSELLVHLSANYTPSRPNLAAIRSTGEYGGRLAIEFAPPPSTLRQYEFAYKARPQKLSILEERAGTVSVSSGGTTVTGSGTAFTDDMIGSVIRFSSDGTTEPTSIIGRSSSGSHVRNPAAFESVVVSVASATVLEIEDSSDAEYSSVKYVVSDLIDLEPGAMYEYFLRLAESKYARSSRNVDERERERLDVVAMQALREAMAADSRNSNFNATEAGTRFYTLADWDNASG